MSIMLYLISIFRSLWITGLAEATVGMGREMLQSSSVLTRNFKTQQYYGYQPIMVPEFVKNLLAVSKTYIIAI